MRNQAGDGFAGDYRIGVDADVEIFGHLLEAVVQGFSFAGIGLGENYYFPGANFILELAGGDLERPILRAVVNDDDAQVAIARRQHRANRALDDFLFVICGDQHCDRRPEGGIEVLRRRAPNAVDGGERANNKEASGHEDVAEEEDHLHADEDDAEHPEGQVIDARCPHFARRGERRHHLGAGLVDEFRNGNDLVAAGADAVDDQREGSHGLRAVSAAVVKKNDVALVEIFEDVFGDLGCAVTRA